MTIALIATDLDGTLIRSDGTVSARTRSAIRAAHDAGIVIAFVTARPPRSVDDLADHLGLTGLAVCCNGALLYDLERRTIVGSQHFSNDIYRSLIIDFRKCLPGVSFAIQDGAEFAQEQTFPPYWDDWHPEPVRRIKCALTLLPGRVAKIIAHHPSYRADALSEFLGARVKERAQISHSGLPIIELAPAGISKGSGLATLCDSLGIHAANVVAFGDMPNDLEMLSFAGHSVGVANAHPHVLDLVHEITQSNDDDGVALVIERLLE